MLHFDVGIIGAGPGGIYSAYELLKLNPNLRICIFEKGKELAKRKCPIDNIKIKQCVNCNKCSIMNGFGGAGAFSDGKYNITNEFGGSLGEYIGNDYALEIMRYVDDINMKYLTSTPSLYKCTNHEISKQCMCHDLHLLNADIRHLGTDGNYEILKSLYEHLKNKVCFYFNTEVTDITPESSAEFESIFTIYSSNQVVTCNKCIVSVGRSGANWIEQICYKLNLPTTSNKVDIGVRIELPFDVFSHLTDELYESKIVYRTKTYQDLVRTFCMNPHGEVVTENTNGIISVNGHSYEDVNKHTNNTNFALLVSNKFSEPFHNSNEYGQHLVSLSNMLGGGVVVQRFGDLIRGQRSTKSRINGSFCKPTLEATPGDLSLILPKRILDDIVEMIYALDKVAPGTANDDTLLYGVEVKFYNTVVQLDNTLQTEIAGLYMIGDGCGVTHSLSQASASGIYVARQLLN